MVSIPKFSAGRHSIEKAFPFRLVAYMGIDGVPVVEVETADALPEFHDRNTVPILRVYVNDDLVDGHAFDLADAK